MEIITDNLRLSSLDLDKDVPDLHVACADPLVMSLWLYQEPSASVDETRARLSARRDLEDAQLWSVRRRGDGKALGLVERVGATSPPGVGWVLRRDAWRQGIMSEAAPAVIAHLLGPGGLDRVEAWADATNVASIKVAQRSGLTERGRFPRGHADGGRHETVVLGRSRREVPQDLYGANAVLPVRDVPATMDLVCAALGCEPGFRYGDPVTYAAVRLGPWSSSGGFHLAAAGQEKSLCAGSVYIQCGAPIADLYARVQAAGGRTDGPPQAMPWGRTEFWFRLPEGHRLIVSGPA